ncbi:ThiF family adenylyltransferase [Salinibacterium sp. M195]|uniref:ThiF family adenylyltransferase n=1 Tax=Salinibacterium sp. M195 TaxID=2583374 RepID=UPI001C63B332|nr:ThiF family adenylyltransferase [Salinibacterium sp. M195]QYH36725.1 molybdopterin biosynthesis protein MoeB [Salinibacterium sp. M195]
MTDQIFPSETALVEPGAQLTAAQLVRYSRQLSNPDFGELAQRRLGNSRVLVIGAGGLGSATIPSLAAMGIGTLGVVDTDVVELSNLHRQLAHGVADIGRSKLESVAETVAQINPDIDVRLHEFHLDSSNALALFHGYDLVLDGSDNFATRYLVNDAAALVGIPVVWGAILRYGGQTGVAWASHGPTYRDLFPVPPHPDTVLSCAEGGVLPTVCAAIGAIMCSETIKLLTGIGQPLLGRVTSYDALSGRFREIEYSTTPDSAPITELIDYELFCNAPAQRETAGAVNETDIAIDSHELAALLSADAAIQLVDVREPFERAIVAIEPSLLVPLGQLGTELGAIRSDVPVVLYCHHGVRSERALRLLRESGFTNVRHLSGGIDAYSLTIDPTMTRY